jgi:hypothetical protein
MPDGEELPESLKAQLRVAVPGYKLLSILGRGGQATVYKAVDRATGATVAVKLLHGGPFADSPARRRLQREIVMLKALDHPNIVRYLSSGQTSDGHDYLVMNYVDGRSLDEFWRGPHPSPAGPPADPAGTVRLFARICRAVGAAHRSGVTHRDLSPSNIRIDAKGEPHVLDFGLARSAFDAFVSGGQPAASVASQFIGKMAYASPEQTGGKPDAIDIRTDVYALGVILYQILTGGQFPYEVEGNAIEMLQNILHAPPTPPSEARARRPAGVPGIGSKGADLPEVNRIIEAVVFKALEKDPERRYQSATQLAQDVEDYLNGRPTTAGGAISGRVGARPTRVQLVVGAGVVLTAGLAWWDWQAPRGTREYGAGVPSSQLAGATSIVSPPAGQGAHDADMQSPTPASPSASGVRHVNLLGLIDPVRDVVGDHRNWGFRDGVLVSHAKGNQLEFPYDVPDEYDYRVTFEAPTDLTVQLMFFAPAHGRRINWVVGERENRACGLDRVDGKPSSQNLTTKWATRWIRPGERNTVVVGIRDRHTSCYVNDTLVADYRTDYHEIGQVEWLKFKWPGTAGVMFQAVGVGIVSAEIVEITGTGRSPR